MPLSDYIDCLLRITNHNQATFEFEGESHSGKPNLEPEVLGPVLLKNETDAEQYGIELFRKLFPPDDKLIIGYRSALSLSRQQQSSLRLSLQIDETAPPDLFAINWERLYDEDERQALSRWSHTAFSRHTGLGQPLRQTIKGPSKLLVVISSPRDFTATNLDPINRAKVIEEMTAALEPLSTVVQYEFLEPPATSNRIRERLREGFHAVHIQAHGVVPPDRNMAWMMLEKENGEAHPIDEELFREIFGGHPDLRLVVLIACQSGVPTRSDPFGGLGQTLVQQNLPFVIAMQRSIEFKAAEIFNENFYRELASHGQIDVAVNEARLHLRLSFPKEIPNWSVPVLFIRSEESRMWAERRKVEVRSIVEVRTKRDPWKPILTALEQKDLVPIIGPDINRGLFPTNEEITRLWTEEYHYYKSNYPSNNRNDLPRVARFVEAMENSRKFPHRRLQTLYVNRLLTREEAKKSRKLNGRAVLLNEVVSAIAQRYFDADEESPHRILADLNISTYLTATPDTFMAEALRYRGRPPQTHAVDWQSEIEPEGYNTLTGTLDSPIVWHLFGAYPRIDQVLTEDDYLDFLRNVSKERWRIPDTLKSKLTEAFLLFLGFNVRDLDFRILFKALSSHIASGSGRIAILQIEPDERERQLEINHMRTFMEKDCLTPFNIQIRWASVRNFLLELQERAPASGFAS